MRLQADHLIVAMAFCSATDVLAMPHQDISIRASTKDSFKDIFDSLPPEMNSDKYKARYNKGKWRDVTCDAAKSLKNAYSDSKSQYKDAKAGDAWSDLVSAWGDYKKDSNIFPNFASNFFNGKVRMDCHQLDTANCDTTTTCGQKDAPNGNVNSPAGTLILNSFAMLHMGFQRVRDGISLSTDTVSSMSGLFGDVFSAQKKKILAEIKETKRQKLIADGVALGFAFVSAFAFNSLLKKMPPFRGADGGAVHGNKLGVLKDDVNAMAQFATNFYKDSRPGGVAELNLIDNEISASFGTITKSYQEGIEKMNDKFFRDPKQLARLVKDGKSYQPDGELIDPISMSNILQKFVFGMMIEPVWSAGPEVGMPVIITMSDLPLKEGGKGCNRYDLSYKKGFKPLMKPNAGHEDPDSYQIVDNFEDSRICYSDGRTEQFVIMSVRANDYCWEDNICKKVGPFFEHVVGQDALYKSSFGISMNELVLNAVNTWKKNGLKNGWKPNNWDDPKLISEVVNGGENKFEDVKGLVGIPVCSFREAAKNAYDYQYSYGQTRENIIKDNPNWPCNK